MDLSNKLSDNLKRCIKEALKTANTYQAPHVGINFFLLALFQQKGSLAYEMLHAKEIVAEELQTIMIGQPELLAKNTKTSNPLALSPELQDMLLRAFLLAQKHHHYFVGTEHCLAVMLDNPPHILNYVCELYAIDKKKLQTQISALLRGNSKFPELTKYFQAPNDFGTDMPSGMQGMDPFGPPQPPSIEQFAVNITDERYQQNVNPVIKREKEIERLIQILCRKDKNNPVILGEPGVGKTALVEGLAKKILHREVPPILHNKKILSLDLGLVVAGTMYRGDFEQRLKSILDEVKHNPNIILFIDELHNLVGAGSSSGTMDAANLLKPLLARGELRCIGATTMEEFKKFIEKDAALERRFQPVILGEPSTEETLTILHGIKENYEKFHQVKFSDDALEAAVYYSSRYIQDKLLPDKAIDLIDEAASKQKIKNSDNSYATEIRACELEMEKIREQKNRAVLNEEFNLALKLKEMEQVLQQKIELLVHEQAKNAVRSPAVINKAAIIEMVAQKTHIPMAELLDNQRQTLQQLGPTLKSRIMGQDEAIDRIVRVITRAKLGFSDEQRPLASIMLLGPSGVGKTLTAKILAQSLFHDKESFIRIDMSEYSEKFNATKLVGAPAGYVGYREGNKLTDSVKKRPASLVLLDEIDKAHPDVLSLLLQVLEDGHLTDATGKQINFKNTILIMTSNLGHDVFTHNGMIGFGASKESPDKQQQEQILNVAKKHFKPEFINRVDALIHFNQLSQEAIRSIVQVEIEQLGLRLARRGVTIGVGSATITELAQKTNDQDVGARGVKRVIFDTIEKQITDKILETNENTFIFP